MVIAIIFWFVLAVFVVGVVVAVTDFFQNARPMTDKEWDEADKEWHLRHFEDMNRGKK